jgi:hypothetical protein
MTVVAPADEASETFHVAPSSCETSTPRRVATNTFVPDCENCVASDESTFVHDIPPFVERNVPPNSVDARSTDGFA